MQAVAVGAARRVHRFPRSRLGSAAAAAVAVGAARCSFIRLLLLGRCVLTGTPLAGGLVLFLFLFFFFFFFDGSSAPPPDASIGDTASCKAEGQ